MSSGYRSSVHGSFVQVCVEFRASVLSCRFIIVFSFTGFRDHSLGFREGSKRKSEIISLRRAEAFSKLCSPRQFTRKAMTSHMMSRRMSMCIQFGASN